MVYPVPLTAFLTRYYWPKMIHVPMEYYLDIPLTSPPAISLEEYSESKWLMSLVPGIGLNMEVPQRPF